MKRLAILGASGHGKVVADAAEYASWDKIIFYDDAWPAVDSVNKWQVDGDTKTLIEKRGEYEGVVVAIGDNQTRLRKCRELLAEGLQLVSIVHPRACLSPYCEYQAGSVFFAGAIVNIGAKLGMATIVNTGSTIDHDCRLGDGVHVSPGVNLAGGVSVGDMTWIGIGASVRQLVNIGKGVTIAAGAVVIDDIENEQLVGGIPAKVIKKNDK